MSTFRHTLLFISIAAAMLAPHQAPGDEPAKADPPNHEPRAAAEIRLPHGDLSATSFSLSVANALLAPNGLGIDIAPPEASLRAQLGLEQDAGLVVTAAPDESGGAKAGLKVHDVIVQLDDQQVGDVSKFHERLSASDGRPVKVRVLRQGKPIEIEATPQNPLVARLAVDWLWRTHLLAAADQEHYRIGVTLSASDETLRMQLRLAEGEGLVVTEVLPDSAAATAGIQKHDVLIVLDGKRLTTVEAINSQIQEIKEKSVELRLLRGGKEMTLQIAPRKSQEPSLADGVVFWDTQNCRSCHRDTLDAAHLLMGTRLHAAHSTWTDGHRLRLYDYALTKTENASTAEPTSGPQQRIDALKTQLGEMQKALSALEAALKPADK